MKKTFTGHDLIALGYTPGKYFQPMLLIAQNLYSSQDDIPKVLGALDAFVATLPVPPPTIPLQDQLEVQVFMDVPNQDCFERSNALAAITHANALSRVPTIRNVYVMPDACPAGSEMGTIPVGCVAVAENAIHPGMHSADICCSMFLSDYDATLPVGEVLDAVQKHSHFGPSHRKEPLSLYLLDSFWDRVNLNPFLNNAQMRKAMEEHMGTQGDGNHFFFVGKSEQTSRMTFVTHHGSRKPGALLYKAGMKVAEEFRRRISPATPKHNAWIPMDTVEGVNYWDALILIRDWTFVNHLAVHNEVRKALEIDQHLNNWHWNEHNFVFLPDEHSNKYYHAKGSTPMYKDDRSIIPLNMGEPILIVQSHPDNTTKFAPHGAGRNMSRTQFMKQNAGKTVEQMMQEQVGHIDARFYTGISDASELPGAYKSAVDVQRQIEHYKLARIVDRIMPLGSMMAGESPQLWRNKQ